MIETDGYDSFPSGDSPSRRGPFCLKPLHDGTDDAETASPSTSASSNNLLERHLTLWDLMSVGIGGTIGSGLFVLCGLVAHDYAGPSTSISWALSGIAALVSGCCYAEMASRIPAAGSAYIYTYTAMGELFGIVAAMCLGLEYILAASAVARSWADKMILYLQESGVEGVVYLEPNLWSASPLAFAISSASVYLLLIGVQESKRVTNIVTVAKVGVVTFMVVAGFFWVQPTNWTPFIPVQFGVSGVLRGSTATFFGYLGYDEICQLAGETIQPHRNLPLAILGTLVSVTTLYIAASLALTGMQSYDDVSPISGFPHAFRANGALIAAQITALGEVLTLPVVIPLTIIGQPRLQFALARDGLLPAWFGQVDANGNLYNGTLFCGALVVLLATFVPFEHLNDVISCAVLSALSLTDTSLILLWHESPTEESYLAETLLSVYHVACLVLSVTATHFLMGTAGWTIIACSCITMLVCVYGVYRWCPQSQVFGGKRRSRRKDLREELDYFRTPLLPFWPCLGILINWYLVSQLELTGIVGMLGFLLIAVTYYFGYASKYSMGSWRCVVHVDKSLVSELSPLADDMSNL